MKVLVVGAGIAGPTMAYWLLRSGHQPTLVEHAHHLRRGGYLVDFWGAGFDVAKMMGIVPQLREGGYVMSEARVVDRRGRTFATINPAAIIESNERYVSVARGDLAAVIYDALEGEVPLVLGQTVCALDDHGDGVQVTYTDGRTEDVDLVIGADGLHSRVRQLAFGPDDRYERFLGIVVAAFETTGYHHRDELVALMHADIGFQVLRVSLRDDKTLFLVSARHDGSIPVDDVSEQKALIRRLLAHAGWEVPAILDEMSAAAAFYFDAVSQIRMPHWSAGRVALVGDAGAAPSFLAGQGSALAMVEAYTLAAELSQAELYPGGHGEAFRRYEERLQPLIQSKQDAATGLALAFAPKDRWQLTVRNAVMRVMGLPKIPDLVMGRSFHDRVTLPAGPRSVGSTRY